ncbi:MAG: hypothetical protein ACJ79S_22005 [Gemmatimonadaceae bacterium]
MRSVRHFSALALLVCGAACSGGTQGGAAGAPAPDAGTTAGAGGTTSGAPAASQAWPVKTREHVDLWLHGFAMVQPDTTRVPLFRRGYRDELTVARNRGNVTTLLDANRQQLAARFAANPSLTGAQFLALYATSWEELVRATQLFIQANGDPNRARSQQEAGVITTLAQAFPSAADRQWLVLFMRSLEDERAKFYHDYWVRQQQERAGALAAVDSLWQRRYRPRMQRFLNNTQQANGELVLSLPLNGEGRTVSGGKRQNVVTVNFPATAAAATEAIYAYAHETAGVFASTVVSDNTSPAEKRSGGADRIQSSAAVLAGYYLVLKTSPELADGYARYYLNAANVSSAGANAESALVATFPVPANIREEIRRQLDVVLGGI